MQYWLIKSEPDAYSIDDLAADEGQKTHWDGIRNYQARNFIRDRMQIGDQALYYHSNTKIPGVIGIVEIISDAYPDHTAFDPESHYYDPKSDPDNPRWLMRDVKLVRKLKRLIPLPELRQHHDLLPDFTLLRRGNRLSLFPISEYEWDYVLGLEEAT